MDTVYVLWVSPYSYFLFGTHKKIQRERRRKRRRKKNKNDADTMYDNTSLTVTQNAYVSKCQVLIQLTKINMESVKHRSQQIEFGKCCIIRVKWILASSNENTIG